MIQAVEPQIPSTLLNSALVVAAMWALLKYLVSDKLKGITDGLASHEQRIRKQELVTANLRGALQARGCLLAEACPLNEDPTES